MTIMNEQFNLVFSKNGPIFFVHAVNMRLEPAGAQRPRGSGSSKIKGVFRISEQPQEVL
jgi:hypothetical protein